jgi:hypothetical protein
MNLTSAHPVYFGVRVMVFNATFNNITVMSWRLLWIIMSDMLYNVLDMLTCEIQM